VVLVSLLVGQFLIFWLAKKNDPSQRLDNQSFLICFSTTLYLPNNSLKFAGQSLCDDNIQTTKFVTCQDRISQNYPFADFSSSAQTAAFFLSKGSLYSGAQFIWHCF
jgi:hypothetical protein